MTRSTALVQFGEVRRSRIGDRNLTTDFTDFTDYGFSIRGVLLDAAGVTWRDSLIGHRTVPVASSPHST